MSTDLSTPAAPAPSEPSPSIVSILGDLIVSPREAFAAILRNPSPWLPVILYVGMHLLLVAVWIPQMDAIEYVKNQQELSGREGPVPPAEAAPVIKAFTAVAYLLLPPLIALIGALVLLAIYRFFFGAEVSFKQSFTIVSWTFAIIALATIPLILGVMALKGDWSQDASNALAANGTLLMDRSTASKPLYALVKAFDLFGLWTLWLLASGFSVLMRKPTGSALAGVVVPWALLVMLGVGVAAMF